MKQGSAQQISDPEAVSLSLQVGVRSTLRLSLDLSWQPQMSEGQSGLDLLGTAERMRSEFTGWVNLIPSLSALLRTLTGTFESSQQHSPPSGNPEGPVQLPLWPEGPEKA